MHSQFEPTCVCRLLPPLPALPRKSEDGVLKLHTTTTPVVSAAAAGRTVVEKTYLLESTSRCASAANHHAPPGQCVRYSSCLKLTMKRFMPLISQETF